MFLLDEFPAGSLADAAPLTLMLHGANTSFISIKL